MDHADDPLRASQLIGSLLIRLVQYARDGNVALNYFPDRPLMDAILELCHHRTESEEHLVQILFHLTKILDDCSEVKQKKLPRPSEPPKAIQTTLSLPAPKWEVVPLKT